MSGISEDGEEVRGFPKPAGHDQSAKHHFRHLRAKRRGGVQAMRARVPQRLLRSDTHAPLEKTSKNQHRFPPRADRISSDGLFIQPELRAGSLSTAQWKSSAWTATAP